MLVRRYQRPSSPRADRQPLRLEPSPQRPVLFSLPNRGPLMPSPPAPRVLSNPFSYPDPLSAPQGDPMSLRVQEIRRLQAGTVAFETLRRRHNRTPNPSGPIRPASADGQRRQPRQTRAGASRGKPARPCSAGHKAKPPSPRVPLKRN